MFPFFSNATGAIAYANLGKIPPTTIAKGTPMIRPYISTSPILALTASDIATGPGCGGRNPCVTAIEVAIGIPTCKLDIFILLANVNTKGINNTNATSKNKDIPIINDAIIIAKVTYFLPNVLISVSAILVAPPPSDNNLPKIEPNPKIIAI
ncbi:Uncharacterised protein [Staphylococcus aureus]|nr:Uncharacterised protein [Staphylococcus aureus]